MAQKNVIQTGLIAGDTWANLLEKSIGCFLRPFRISEKSSTNGNHIDLSIVYNFSCQNRIVDSPHSCNGD